MGGKIGLSQTYYTTTSASFPSGPMARPVTIIRSSGKPFQENFILLESKSKPFFFSRFTSSFYKFFSNTRSAIEWITYRIRGSRTN